jgi:hypothetical protein
MFLKPKIKTMKKIYLLLIGICLVAFNINAQKWVSTTPQNKKVVLEEYTGLHCGYCPDGHRMANDFVAANPGKVFLVNIHAGYFATPSTGEPDFRTTEGNALNLANGVSSYPNGSINRSTNPWGQSRNLWSGLITGILGQSSPVNVAVRATADFASRTLTTEVEAYYTANSPQSKNYLTVMLLQSDYAAYQSDYGSYNPTNWCTNGYYKHNHILRMILSKNGTSGEALDTTTLGKYYYKKYVTTLPANITNVELYLSKLSVVAFVAESTAQIYSADETDVPFDNANESDLAMTDQTVKPTENCFTTINPKIEVTNNSSKTITNFDVSALIGGTNYPKSYTGSLTPGSKTTIDWGNVTYSAKGNYTVFLSGFSNINTGTLEDAENCDNKFSFSGVGFTKKAFSSISASFEGTLANNFIFDYSENSYFSMFYSNSGNIGAKNTAYGIGFRLMSTLNLEGKAGRIMFGEADLETISNPYFTFYYAYSDGGTGGTAPTIKVEVSEDCASTWTEIRSIVPSENTYTCTNSTTNPTAIFAPATTNYHWVGVPLTAYKNKPIMLRVSGIPGNDGNSLWLDEFKVGNATGIEITDNSTVNFSIYPNPVSDVANISFSLMKTSEVSFELYNTLGQKLLSTEDARFNEGDQTMEVNTSTLEQGTYIGVLKVDGKSFTTKLVK